MRYLLLIAVFALIGCGDGSTSSRSRINVSRQTVVFLGDSLAGGSSHAPGVVTYPNLIPGIVSINRGASGDTSAQMLARLDECFTPLPELLVFEGGLNDIQRGVSAASYHEHIESIINECRSHQVKVILCTIPNSSVGDPAAYNAALRSLAAEYGCQLADLQNALQNGNIGLLEPDGEHPNQQGQNAIGATLAPLLQ